MNTSRHRKRKVARLTGWKPKQKRGSSVFTICHLCEKHKHLRRLEETMVVTSSSFDNSEWSDFELGSVPLSNRYHVLITSTGKYSLTPQYTEKMVGVLEDRLYKWKVDFSGFKDTLEEYFDWLFYIRIQEVTREGKKVVNAKSNQLVVPTFISATLERIGLAYSKETDVTLVPKFDGDPFEKWGKTVEQAAAFIISTASRLRAMMDDAGLPYTTSISREQAGDYDTMILRVEESKLTLGPADGEHFELKGMRAMGETKTHPIHGMFASMLGVRQIERTFMPNVYYDTFDVMKEELLKAVLNAKSTKPRTVPRDRNHRHDDPRGAGTTAERG